MELWALVAAQVTLSVCEHDIPPQTIVLQLIVHYGWGIELRLFIKPRYWISYNYDSDGRTGQITGTLTIYLPGDESGDQWTRGNQV